MAQVQIASGTITTNLDALPVTYPTAGEGAATVLKVVEDVVAVPRTGFATAGNFMRLCRFPTKAKVKKVELFTDLSLIDGGTSSTALVLSVGVIFSDDTNDGTPASLQNLQPTTVGVTANGGSTTAGTAVVANGTSANFIYGTITAVTTTGAIPAPATTATVIQNWFGGEITFNATATYGTPYYMSNTSLARIFNFVDGGGVVTEDLGYFDLIVMATTGYNTQPAAAYNLYGRVSYAA